MRYPIPCFLDTYAPADEDGTSETAMFKEICFWAQEKAWLPSANVPDNLTSDRLDQSLWGRGVHEVKVQQVVDADGLQHQPPRLDLFRVRSETVGL